jgi:membrane protease YdiL (CAAX protease family)
METITWINKGQLFNFLAITFGLSWTVGGVLYLVDIDTGSIWWIVTIALLYMTAPGIAALLLKGRPYRQLLQAYGLLWKNLKAKDISLAIGCYLAFLTLTFFLIFLFGNIWDIEGFGTLSVEKMDILANVAQHAPPAATPSAHFPPVPALIVAGVVGSIIAGCTLNLPFAIGEELGWRGFMMKQTATLGFWKGNLCIGIIWGIWHWPLIWAGHNYPGYPLAGSLLMILFCISLSLMHSIVRLKTNSLLIPAALHGMINAGAPMSLLFITGNSILIGSIVGVAGVLAACLISAIYLTMDKEPIKKYTTV